MYVTSNRLVGPDVVQEMRRVVEVAEVTWRFATVVGRSVDNGHGLVKQETQKPVQKMKPEFNALSSACCSYYQLGASGQCFCIP